MSKKKSNKKKQQPRVNPELEGFNIKIDSFGEVKSNFDIDQLNEFLNRNVEDKKLKDRKDPKEKPKGKGQNKQKPSK